MLKNYLKTTIRNIFRNKFYSAINIIGLAIGIICTILILLYNQSELTYDKHHVKHNRIFRLESDFTIAGKNDLFAVTSLPLAPTLKEEYPEIEEFVRFARNDNTLFKYGEKEFYEDSIYFADSTIFKIFSHNFLKGNQGKALTEPNTMVITSSFANRFFGNENPIGKVITSAL